MVAHWIYQIVYLEKLVKSRLLPASTNSPLCLLGYMAETECKIYNILPHWEPKSAIREALKAATGEKNICPCCILASHPPVQHFRPHVDPVWRVNKQQQIAAMLTATARVNVPPFHQTTSSVGAKIYFIRSSFIEHWRQVNVLPLFIN